MKNVTESDNTGMVDINGRPIFIGDKVIKEWGGAPKGKTFRMHTITKYIDKNRIEFHLGTAHNRWEGHEVGILSPQDLKELEGAGIKEDDDFYLIDEKPEKLDWETTIFRIGGISASNRRC